MKIDIINDEIYIRGLKAFNLKSMLECGQAFRWDKDNTEEYIGIVKEMVIKVRQYGDTLIFRTSGGLESIPFWINYFDIERDYVQLESELLEDKTIAPAVFFSSGNRILKQDPWECLMSFIISSNNRIPMIKKVIQNLSENYGDPITFEGSTYYSFPDSKVLSEISVEEITECKCGYRAEYIKKTSEMVMQIEGKLESLREKDTHEAFRVLTNFRGVGPKVANCVLLFSLQKYDAFPIDTWIKRIMEHLYFQGEKASIKKIEETARERFGDKAGFVQQYLFYYARENWDEIS
ncbi:MAG TPA: DNA-3-methyladenine glycosylase 2 [Thermoanaerobacterales bacterium]|nr:DNA-3-methyladenine glycosylase 2 [Thermoanaerobacterales bacterium]